MVRLPRQAVFFQAGLRNGRNIIEAGVILHDVSELGHAPHRIQGIKEFVAVVPGSPGSFEHYLGAVLGQNNPLFAPQIRAVRVVVRIIFVRVAGPAFPIKGGRQVGVAVLVAVGWGVTALWVAVGAGVP